MTAAIEPGRLMCSGCIHPRDHPAITHSPLGSPTWCSWTACGHNVHVGQEACTADHPAQHNQEGTTTVPDNDKAPPAKKAAAPRKAAAPTPLPPGLSEPVLSPAQQARIAALDEAQRLLGAPENEVSSFDLLEVARFIVGEPVDDHDDGDVLTFTGPTPTEGDKQ